MASLHHLCQGAATGLEQHPYGVGASEKVHTLWPLDSHRNKTGSH